MALPVFLSDFTSLTPPLTGMFDTLITYTGSPVRSMTDLLVVLSIVNVPVEDEVPTYPAGTVSVYV